MRIGLSEVRDALPSSSRRCSRLQMRKCASQACPAPSLVWPTVPQTRAWAESAGTLGLDRRVAAR